MPTSRAAHKFFNLILAIGLSCFAFALLCGGRAYFKSQKKPIYRSAEDIKLLSTLLNLNTGQVQTLLQETWFEAWEYAPWVGFKERPRNGNFVNVNPEGFRFTPQAPAKAAHEIDLFGGSTLFGYNVADNQTISFYLQQAINQKYPSDLFVVRNYGRGFYYSSQEHILLWLRLQAQPPPSIALFLDGLNEGQRLPAYSNAMSELFDRFHKGSQQKKFSLKKIAANIYHPDGSVKLFFSSPEESAEQYLFNHKNILSLCKIHNVKTFFFIQPMPGFDNKFSSHAFLKETPQDFITRIQLLLSKAKGLENTFSMTGLLKDYDKQPFVDAMHYVPDVNQKIALEMLRVLSPTLDFFASKKN